MGVELHPGIAAAIQSGATILTPSQRAARTLHRAWDQLEQASGQTLWQSPAILTFETWLGTLHTRLLLEGHEKRIVLNRAQQHTLWRSVIAPSRLPTAPQDLEFPTLQSMDALADLTARAARLLHLYRGSANAPEFGLATDTRAFQRWSQAFDRLCLREGFLPESLLPAVLLEALTQGKLTAPDLVLADFDSTPPAHAVFLDALRAAGSSIQHLQTSSPAPQTELHPAPDQPSELHTAAHWVRRQLELDPTTRVAVVVPALQTRRADIDRVFAEVLAPDLQPITESDTPLPYEFSLGIPLLQTAPVAAALPLLLWPAEALPLETISALLLSPCFGSPTTPAALAVAAFDAHILRRTSLLRPQLSLESFTTLLAEHAGLAALATRLRALLRAAAGVPERQPHAAWADHFRALLVAAAWAPGSDSLDFQIGTRWESLLDELATLDFRGESPTRAEALAALNRLARQTIFAPESRQALVQILGPLELGGVPFDALWFLGADDLAWPARLSTNPLLPFALQRRLGMPGADPTRDATQARTLTARIAQSAAHVVFSFATQSDEGTRRPSSVLEPLALSPFPHEPQPPAAPAPALLTIIDAEPLPPLPDRVYQGGARILELQAACPFRAFAELRLHAVQPETRDPGFDPRDRGLLVHTVMELFWAEASTQEQLRAMPEQARHALLDRAIASALEEAEARTQTPWDEAYLEVQRLRLQQLLRPWLAVELDRPNFAVASHERRLRDISLGPLRLNLRVDRIDSTAGGPLILDYKTGAATPADWLSERPEAPQLPLYAIVAANEELGGVAFANLRAGDDLALKGFADSPAVLAKSSRMEAATLADQVDQWRQYLTALAEAFAAGDARVDPKAYPQTCTRCTQRILCRLDPATLDQVDEEDSAAPAGYGVSHA